MRDGVGISTEHGIRTDRPRFGVTGLALSPAGGRPNGSSRSCTRSAPERGVWREGKRRAQSHLYWGADRERNIFDATTVVVHHVRGEAPGADFALSQKCTLPRLGRPFLEVRGYRQHDWLQRLDTGGMDCEFCNGEQIAWPPAPLTY